MEEFKTTISKLVEEKRALFPKGNSLSDLSKKLDMAAGFTEEIKIAANEILARNQNMTEEEVGELTSFYAKELLRLVHG